MAAATKAARTLTALATALAAAGTVTSTAWNMTNALGGLLVARVTNTTAPTTNATITVNLSVDNVTWFQYLKFAVPTTASTTFDYAVEIPPSALYAQVVFVGGATNAQTCSAFGHELTSIQ